MLEGESGRRAPGAPGADCACARTIVATEEVECDGR